MRFHQIW